MARDEYNPNDFFDQLAAISEAALLSSIIAGIEDDRTKKIFTTAIDVCGKYGIKGMDAIKFINELGSLFAGIEGLSGDDK